MFMLCVCYVYVMFMLCLWQIDLSNIIIKYKNIGDSGSFDDFVILLSPWLTYSTEFLIFPFLSDVHWS